MSSRKHPLPSFLQNIVSSEAYERWLERKAQAHVKRDRKRERSGVTGAAYRDAIHEAVSRSNGLDAYTGEQLAWHLISQYDNDRSKEGRHHYKAGFALLPTVDHVEASADSASFHICAWRTNDAKNDLSVPAFIELCVRVLKHAGYQLNEPANPSFNGTPSGAR
jgi:hypothetical protein